MKPDDSNLTVEEYIKYFADENATKFFNELINEVNALKAQLKEFDNLKDELCDSQYDIDNLSSKNWSLETQIEELEEEIQMLKNDILRLGGK
jgi:peptidoglycan hydrolase CwlO-like protein